MITERAGLLCLALFRHGVCAGNIRRSAPSATREPERVCSPARIRWGVERHCRP